MVGAEEVCDAAVTKAAGLRSQDSAVDGPIHKKGSIRAIFFGFVRYENDGKMGDLVQHRVPLRDGAVGTAGVLGAAVGLPPEVGLWAQPVPLRATE